MLDAVDARAYADNLAKTGGLQALTRTGWQDAPRL